MQLWNITCKINQFEYPNHDIFFCNRSGKEFDITAQRVAASNGFLKEAFIDALKQSE